MVIYSMSPKEIPKAKPEGFPMDSGYFSQYIPTQITIHTFSISIPVLSFLGEQYWKI